MKNTKMKESKYALMCSLFLAKGLYVIWILLTDWTDSVFKLGTYESNFISTALVYGYYIAQFIVWWLIGVFIYAKIKEKKKALAIAIVMEMLINVFICVSQTLLHGNSNFVQAVYEYTVANNIFTALFWIIIVGYHSFGCVLSTLLAPASVLFVVIFNKIYEAIKKRNT